MNWVQIIKLCKFAVWIRRPLELHLWVHPNRYWVRYMKSSTFELDLTYLLSFALLPKFWQLSGFERFGSVLIAKSNLWSKFMKKYGVWMNSKFGTAQPFFTPGSAVLHIWLSREWQLWTGVDSDAKLYRNAHFSLLNLISSAEIKIDVWIKSGGLNWFESA